MPGLITRTPFEWVSVRMRLTVASSASLPVAQAMFFESQVITSSPGGLGAGVSTAGGFSGDVLGGGASPTEVSSAGVAQADRARPAKTVNNNERIGTMRMLQTGGDGVQRSPVGRGAAVTTQRLSLRF